MKYRATLINGDGTGPEVVDAARRCIEAAADRHNFDILWEEMPAGESALEEFGSALPERTIRSIAKNRIALKGPITTPIGKGFRSVNVGLRQRLDLYANVRPAKLFKGLKSRYDEVDLVVVRESTEDLYAGIEFAPGAKDTNELIRFAEKKTSKAIRKGSAVSLKPISRYASRRIVEFAFEYARRNRRRKVTAVHKANIMKYTDGLFLETARSVSKGYRSIAFEDRIVDNMCMQLVSKPEIYDVLVCPNLYGDIVSDLCSGLIGGLGMAPGANIGSRCAVFEPVHGSAPKYAGTDKVNPTATIMSAALMLEHMGEKAASRDISDAVAAVIREGKYLTYDLKPRDHVGTRRMADAVVGRIKKARK